MVIQIPIHLLFFVVALFPYLSMQAVLLTNLTSMTSPSIPAEENLMMCFPFPGSQLNYEGCKQAVALFEDTYNLYGEYTLTHRAPQAGEVKLPFIKTRQACRFKMDFTTTDANYHPRISPSQITRQGNTLARRCVKNKRQSGTGGQSTIEIGYGELSATVTIVLLPSYGMETSAGPDGEVEISGVDSQ